MVRRIKLHPTVNGIKHKLMNFSKRPSLKSLVIGMLVLIVSLFSIREIIIHAELASLREKHYSDPKKEPVAFTNLADEYSLKTLEQPIKGHWVYRKCGGSPCTYKNQTYIELSLSLGDKLSLIFIITRNGKEFYKAQLVGNYHYKGNVLVLEQGQGAKALLYKPARLPFSIIDKDHIKIWLDPGEPVLLISLHLLPKNPKKKNAETI